MLMFVWRGLVRVVGMDEAASSEMDGTHNNLTMWKHFGGGQHNG